MSTDEPSPKRQRRSYSPASPPEPPAENKERFVQPPQTPPPSVHMSPEWTSSNLPGLGGGSNGSGSGSGSVTFPTPPNTAGFGSQMMARGLSSDSGDAARSEMQTPVTGEVKSGDAEMQDTSAEQDTGDVSMTVDDEAEHRRTDHERQEALSSVPPLPGTNTLYKLHTSPIQPSQPNPSQNLISLYSLQRIQSSVARRDPTTGEKINKLRKSYEGKVKDLGLEGRNKATKSDKILEGLVDSAWDTKLEDGRTWWDNSEHAEPLLDEKSLGGVEELLGRALDMRPGHLPNAEHNSWKNLLGLDDSTPVTATATTKLPTTAPLAGGPVRTPASNLLSKASPANALRNSAPASPRTAIRPERAGKKRRYDESSYAGYAEGYEDDGYSTGGGGGGVEDGRRGSGAGGVKRQKRKDFSASSPTGTAGPPFNAAGSGGSMVGVRSS